MQYTATGKELSDAFARAKLHFDSKKPTDKGSKAQGFHVYTIGSSLRYAVGHNTRILKCALGLVSKRLEGKSASKWLMDNGVPKEEVTGLKGMACVRIWKSIWLQKLADELKDDTSEHTYTYPF